MTVELEFLCDVCGRPVGDGRGSLYVRHAAIREYERTAAQWQAATDPGSGLDLAELLAHPDEAPWLIHHHSCAPSDSDGYHIDVERVRTWRALVAWTAHLMSKAWLPVTNWAVVIGGAAEGRDRRIVEHVRGDAA